tara:strand:+ start:2226 stop:2486 length:261 start_codon:yes stop_codon:yes gene_type:complete
LTFPDIVVIFLCVFLGTSKSVEDFNFRRLVPRHVPARLELTGRCGANLAPSIIVDLKTEHHVDLVFELMVEFVVLPVAALVLRRVR